MENNSASKNSLSTLVAILEGHSCQVAATGKTGFLKVTSYTYDRPNHVVLTTSYVRPTRAAVNAFLGY